MKLSELAILYKEYAAFWSSRVEYWISLTTAVLVANYFVGDEIDSELRQLVVFLYTGFSLLSFSMTFIGILRVRAIGRDIKEATVSSDRNHITSAITFSKAHLLTVVFITLFYVLGWFGTVSYVTGESAGILLQGFSN